MEFFAQKDDLKKALNVVSLATDDTADTIWGHALFKISENKENILLYSTNKDKIAFAACVLSNLTGAPEEFTADPKKLYAHINSSDMELIRFQYNEKERTLNVYASENKNSFLSFPSFESSDFLSFEIKLAKASEIKLVNAGMFLMGLRFIQGFLPADDRNQKFARLYIEKDVFYGANGSNKIGAFVSPEFEGLDDLIIRRIMISPVTQMIDRSNPTEISIKDANKHIIFSSDNYGFGFLKTTDQMIKFPIDTKCPKTDSFNTDLNILLKKLNRLAIVSKGDLGIKMVLKNDGLEMSTLSERPSIENLDIKRLEGDANIEFILEYRLAKSVLNLFHASNVDIFVDSSKCTIWSDAELEITEEDSKEVIKKPFKAIGLISQAREVE
jgi:hypothetical protein